jgi:hypothetical protein
MFDVKFCPAFAGHAHAWILEEIAHAKSAKVGKVISKFEMRKFGPTSSRAGGTSKGSRCARRLRRGLKDWAKGLGYEDVCGGDPEGAAEAVGQ